MPTHFTAQVSRIFVNGDTCHVRLAGHGNGYFKIPLSHGNYNAIYSLILSAATSRRNILLRTVGERPAQTESHVNVQYAVADW